MANSYKLDFNIIQNVHLLGIHYFITGYSIIQMWWLALVNTYAQVAQLLN